jgi:hypothetical protein
MKEHDMIGNKNKNISSGSDNEMHSDEGGTCYAKHVRAYVLITIPKSLPH